MVPIITTQPAGISLSSLGLFDDVAENDFENLLDIALSIANTTIGFISFFGEETHHLKSRRGIKSHQLSVRQLPQFMEVTHLDNQQTHNSSIKFVEEIEDFTLDAFPIFIEEQCVGMLGLVNSSISSISPNVIDVLKSLSFQTAQLVQKRIIRCEMTQKCAQYSGLKDVLDASRIGTWVWHVQTGEVHFNKWWFEIIGYQQHELEPISIDTWYQLVHPDDRHISEEELNKCFSKDSDFYNVELRMIHKKGHEVWINDRGKVQEWTEDGRPLIMTGTHVDISERKKKDVLYQAITDNVPGVVFRYHLDVDGKDWAQVVNTGVIDIWGFTAEEVIADLNLIWDHIDKRDIARVQQSVLRSKETMKPWVDEWRYHHPNGQMMWLRGVGKPMRQANGDMIWDTHIQDVTERLIAEEELRESEKLLNEAQKYSKMGNWSYDFRNDRLIWSNALYDVFGIDNQYIETHGSFLSLIVPEDRENARRASLNTQETGEPFNVKYRIVTPQGDERVIEEFGFAEKDDSGKVMRLFGTAQDVTEILLTKKELQENTYQTQVGERKRIAQLIHDSLQQSLIAILMHLNSLDADAMSERNVQILKGGTDLLKETIQQARSISHDLVPPEIVEDGLRGALEGLVKQYEDTNTQISFENHLSNFQQLPITTEIGLYRIAQEGVNNILKHAKATQSKISLKQVGQFIQMRIEDNGVGICKKQLGFGLNGISNRVKNMGGTMDVNSIPDKETVLDIRIPFEGI